MLGSLEIRLDQAQKDHLGYMEFLELLLEDEVQRRASKSLANRVMRARFEEVKTVEGFDFAYNQGIPAGQIRDLCTCEFVERKQSLILCGPVGVGKTHLAQAIGHQACRLGYKVLFIKALRLLADLGGGRADDTWEKRLRLYLQPDLRILDDFCLTPLTPQQAEDFYQLIEERHRHGSLVVTSNRAPQDWYPLFPNPVLAESTLDRLVNCSHQVVLTGRSYRPLLHPDRKKSVAQEVEKM
ncbi:MAG: ATP-binding protein [Chloroflexi bacterium]|nr:ATP-binding protein [Chloroflexota bacterium]